MKLSDLKWPRHVIRADIAWLAVPIVLLLGAAQVAIGQEATPQKYSNPWHGFRGDILPSGNLPLPRDIGPDGFNPVEQSEWKTDVQSVPNWHGIGTPVGDQPEWTIEGRNNSVIQSLRDEITVLRDLVQRLSKKLTELEEKLDKLETKAAPPQFHPTVEEGMKVDELEPKRRGR